MTATPIALFVFNRPDCTARVLTAVRAARPAQLYVVGDGPRVGRTEDQVNCAAVRRVVEQAIDWPCAVQMNFSTENLGCGRRISSGLDWVFEQAERAIVLEDDCVPDPTFFPYCAELLERYADEPRVGMISGCNFRASAAPPTESYFFSAYNFIWGWAAWRRSWRLFDATMTRWPELRDSRWLQTWLRSRTAAAYWHERFDAMHRGQIDTWDYPWTFSLWASGLVSILPSVNLVTNIGFGPGATHSPAADGRLGIAAARMSFPLRHPATITRDFSADHFFERHVFRIGWKHVAKSWLRKARSFS